ncbi:hypothetical protein PHYPSEUDO_008678 [Phytophthora pseudosyringae]|uniref:Uncharacterized protein n=1 Tax=Phytophthora pseudosyringae TaxID=221518 RepID=A0A8T1VEK4_9STRA|nr:hypothetical protein PHYPSEUDO_008678 [Phytophthora pseudosyringae]
MPDAGAHATNSLTNSMSEDTNCREVEDGAESKEQVVKADAKTPLSESESCVDEEAKESVVEMKVTRADAKLMAELDSGAERKTGESVTAAYLKTRSFSAHFRLESLL